MSRKHLLAFTSMIVVLFCSLHVNAQSSVAEILEKARGQAKDVEQLKTVINTDPDPNMRLATFNIMLEDGDDTMRAIALESGLASADKLIQSAAFKWAIMNLNRLHLTLSVDTGSSSDLQKNAKAYLETNGVDYVIELKRKDIEAGTFSGGELSGTHITYQSGHTKAILQLVDDNAVVGPLTLYSGGYMRFNAKGVFR